MGYVNGDTSARTAYVCVSGGSLQAVSCSPLGTWSNNWVAMVQVPVALQAGANTIKFANPWGFGTATQPALSPALKRDNYGNVSIDTNAIASKAITGVSTISSGKAITGVNTVLSSNAGGGSDDPTVDLSSVAIHGE